MNANTEITMNKGLHTRTKQPKMDNTYWNSKKSIIWWILAPAILKEMEDGGRMIYIPFKSCLKRKGGKELKFVVSLKTKTGICIL